MFDPPAIASLMRRILEQSFALYKPEHRIFVPGRSHAFNVQYRTTPAIMPRGTTNFSLEVKGDLCDLIWIRLVEEHRGQGHGRALYGCVETFAKDHGCSCVRMTASGWTLDGQRKKTGTRKDYMLRLGYQEETPGSHSVIKML